MFLNDTTPNREFFLKAAKEVMIVKKERLLSLFLLIRFPPKIL